MDRNQLQTLLNAVTGSNDSDPALLNQIVNEATFTRSALVSLLLDPRRDFDAECGYKDPIPVKDYKKVYSREIGSRIVNSFPDECWRNDPLVIEDEDPDTDTSFELDFANLVKRHNLWHWLHRIDRLSGVGYFGLLFLGFNDGLEFVEPAAGVNPLTGEPGTISPSMDLMYLRVYDNTLCTINDWETDKNSPRYGLPTQYSIKLYDLNQSPAGIAQTLPDMKEVTVHWTRVIHVADNRTTSEVFGVPRQEAPWNRIMDIRKVAGSSAEMYYKGGFPGYAFELSPETVALIKQGDTEGVIDQKKMKETFDNFMNGLQRYIALEGLTAKSLAVQVADPEPAIMSQLKLISVITQIPLRILMGSEAAHLASTQDALNWNQRLAQRQAKYLTPLLLRPFIDRMIATGVVEAPAEQDEYEVTWPDLNTQTDKDKAEVAKTVADALAKYIQGDIQALIPPVAWLVNVMGWEKGEALAALETAMDEMKDEEEATRDGGPLERDRQAQEREDALDVAAQVAGGGNGSPVGVPGPNVPRPPVGR